MQKSKGVIRLKRFFISSAAAAFLLATSATSALAANSHASCMGFEASEISPPGSSSEVTGGMPELNQFVKSFGVPPGTAFHSVAAQIHEGSHEDCDEALE